MGMTKKAGHTPGPLHIFKCPKPSVSIAKTDEGSIWLVAYKDKKFSGEVAICVGENAEANARLYAGSPDLLADCIALIKFYESVRPNGRVLQSDPDICPIRARVFEITHNGPEWNTHRGLIENT